MRSRLLWGGAVLAVSLALLSIRVYGASSPGEAYPVMQTVHIATLDAPHVPYNSTPPTSGPHLGSGVADLAFHTKPVPPELLVHNLEHGHIVIYYGDVSPADQSLLKELQERYADMVVVVPATDGSRGITLTAWGRLLRLPKASTGQIERFIKAYSAQNHHAR
jgi:hypothetical protein